MIYIRNFFSYTNHFFISPPQERRFRQAGARRLTIIAPLRANTRDPYEVSRAMARKSAPSGDVIEATEEQAAPEKDPYWVDALSQGLQVLHAFDTDRATLTLTDIATRLGWSRTKPYRFVHTLEKLGYLAKDDTGRAYRLTTMSMRLGFTYLSRMPLVEMAQPILDLLRAEVRASVHLALLEDKSLVYVALSRVHTPTAVNVHVGSRMPAYASSIGRILLAYQSDENLDRILGSDPIPALTPKSTVDPKKFRAKLARARRDGYLFNDEESHLGIRSIAAPVFDSKGHAIAGINATALTSVFTDERVQDEVIPAVIKAAAELSQGQGFRPLAQLAEAPA